MQEEIKKIPFLANNVITRCRKADWFLPELNFVAHPTVSWPASRKKAYTFAPLRNDATGPFSTTDMRGQMYCSSSWCDVANRHKIDGLVWCDVEVGNNSTIATTTE